MRKIILLLTGCIAVASAAFDPEVCAANELGCWQQCLIPGDGDNLEMKMAMANINTLIHGIKDLLLPCKVSYSGTYYIIDAGIKPGFDSVALYRAQRLIASILALATNVENVCNPFIPMKSSHQATCFNTEWPCKDRCEAAMVFWDKFFIGFDTENQPINVEKAANLVRASIGVDGTPINCIDFSLVRDSGQYVVIANGAIDESYNCSSIPGAARCIVIDVNNNPASVTDASGETSDYRNMYKFAQSSSIYRVEGTRVFNAVLERILNCMAKSCCGSTFNLNGPNDRVSNTFLCYKNGNPEVQNFTTQRLLNDYLFN